MSLVSVLRNTSVHNFINLSLNQGINVVVALVATPLLYQQLGEENYGLVSLALSIVLMCSMLVSYGFNINGPKRLALLLEKPEQQSVLINEVLVTRALLSVVVILGLMMAVYVFGLFQAYATILIFSTVILAGEAVFPMFVLQGLDKLSPLAISNGIIKVSYLVGIVLIVKSPADAPWVNFLLGTATLIVNLVLLIRIYARRSFVYGWVSLSRIWYRLKDNFQFFSYTLAAYVLVNGGFILLNSFVNEAELGRYSLAQRVALLLRTIPAFLTQAILQKASRLFASDRPAFEKYLKRAFVNGLLITLAVGIVFAVAAPWVVRVLAGEFVPYSARVMRLLCFLPFLAMLNLDNMIRILVAEHKHILSRAMWVATLIMLILAVLGSHFHGGYGLAVAMLVSEALNFVIFWLFLRKIRLQEARETTS